MKQAEKIYLISDAAKQVQVESHVLRYWEEELKLPIKRNELGHRYYTEEDITRFRQIRDLKEQGLQLKAIRNMLQKGEALSLSPLQQAPQMQQQLPPQSLPETEHKRHVLMVNKGEFVPISEESKEAKSLRLQQLLQNMIVEAVRSNNREVCDEIKESLLKELDYQFRVQEEREDEREEARTSRQEEHYRQIDELLRARVRRRGFTVRKEKAQPEETVQTVAETVQAADKEAEAVVQAATAAGSEIHNSQSSGEKKEKFGFFQRKKRSII